MRQEISAVIAHDLWLAPAPFIFRSEPNGDVTVTAEYPATVLLNDLRQTRFSEFEDSSGFHRERKTFNKSELKTFITEVLSMFYDYNELLELYPLSGGKRMGSRFAYGTHPFELGRLVYTGNSQDLALKDGTDGHLFIDTKDPKITGANANVYMRGGHITVSADGRLMLEDFELADVKPLPADSTALAVRADGRLFATDGEGHQIELGKLKVVRIYGKPEREGPFKLVPRDFGEGSVVSADDVAPILPAHLELIAEGASSVRFSDLIRKRDAVAAVLTGWREFSVRQATKPTENFTPSALTLHAALPKSTEHLKALGIEFERSGESVIVGKNLSTEALTAALVKVLEGLQKRLSVHGENLRNAGKTRDADGHLNAYRRKTVELGPKGEILDGVDTSELPRNYKPGAPDAGPDGFVVLSNVNLAVENLENRADSAEYQLLREALLRLDPRQVFPEAPRAP